MAKKTTVLEGQSLLDLAIQTGGGLESVFDLAVENDISITESLIVGSRLTNPPVANAQVQNYYTTKRLTPATALPTEEHGEGIEFWMIERDFVVG